MSIESGMLVTCRMQYAISFPRCCSVVTWCLLVESMCLLPVMSGLAYVYFDQL